MAFRIHRVLGGTVSVMTVVLVSGCGSDPEEIKCDDGFEAVVMDEEYFCTENPSSACKEGYIPVQTASHAFACTKPATDVCEDDKILVQQSSGTYACLPAQSAVVCEEGSVAVQQDSGVYTCLAISELACPAGSVPNITNTACTSLSQIVCDDGFVPQVNAKTGVWDCVDASAQARVLRTVSGLLTDCATERPLGGVTVTLQGIGEDLDTTTMTATTDATGAFSASGYISSSGVVWSATIAGYKVKTGVADVVISGGEARYSDPDVIDECLDASPVANLAIAGRVLAGTAPAAGATLYLFDISDNTSVNTKLVQGPVVAGSNGSFVFNAVANSEYEIVVAPYDSTGDGVADFTQLQWTCGDGVELLNCSQNYGNLQLVLPEPDEQALITYTSLLQTDGNLIRPCDVGEVSTADDVCLSTGFDALTGMTSGNQAKWLTPSPSGAVVIQSGLPFAAIATGDVELYRVRSGSVIEQLAVTPSLSSDGLTLSLTPGASLAADQDPATFFELRFRSLAWKNGQYAVVPGANESIYFDVKKAASYLSNPNNITLYPGEVTFASALVTDALKSFWLTSEGTIIQQKELNATDALTIGFTEIAGAAGYKVYARVANFTNALNDTTWAKLTDITPNASNLTGTTRYQVINLSGTFPAPSDWSNRLAYGRQMQIAVTSVTADGAETPIDPTKALVVSDKVMMGIATAADESDAAISTFATSSGQESVKVTFHEKLLTTASPKITLLTADSTTSLIGAAEWAWVDTADETLAGIADELDNGFVKANLRNNKYDVCTTVQQTAGANANALEVASVAAFQGLTRPITAYAFDTTVASIGNQGLPITINDLVDRPTGTNHTLLVSALPADTATPPTGTVNGITSGYTLCVQNALQITNATPATPVATYATLSMDKSRIYDGQTITVLVPGDATVGGVYTYQVRGLAPDGVIISDITAAVATAFTASSVKIFRTPTTWVETTKLNLYNNVTVTTAAPTVRLMSNNLATSQLTAGDRVILDVDGVWSTSGDRVVATVSAVNKTYTTDGVGPEQVSFTLPSASVALTVNSLILKLGPSSYSVGLDSIKDTSGNAGPVAGARRTRLFFCESAITSSVSEPVCSAGGVSVL